MRRCGWRSTRIRAPRAVGRPPCADDGRFRSKPRRAFALDHVRVDEPSDAGVLVDGHSGSLEVVAQQRASAHVSCHLADASEQTRIVERRLIGGYSVVPELSRLPKQTGSVSHRSHRHRSVVRGHSPERVAGDERRASSSRAARRAATTPAGPAPTRGRRTRLGARTTLASMIIEGAWRGGQRAACEAHRAGSPTYDIEVTSRVARG